MIRKFINILTNLKRKIMYAICIDDMETQGKAYHGKCNSYIDGKCLECPYFADNDRKSRCSE